MEIGVDCVEVSRFESLARDKAFIETIFTKKEIEYCQTQHDPTQHFAARFAGKEAVIKALSGFKATLPNFQEIEITREPKQPPRVRLKEALEEEYAIKISLSHTKNTAVAFVVALEKNDIS